MRMEKFNDTIKFYSHVKSSFYHEILKEFSENIYDSCLNVIFVKSHNIYKEIYEKLLSYCV